MRVGLMLRMRFGGGTSGNDWGATNGRRWKRRNDVQRMSLPRTVVEVMRPAVRLEREIRMRARAKAW